jgi:hypothetical protein
MITFSQLGNYGRLGNQLFQVGALIGYSHKHGIPWAVPENWEHLHDFNYTFPTHPVIRGSEYKQFMEAGFEYKEIPRADNINISGYFQSTKYFEGADALVHSIFSNPKDKPPLPMDTQDHHFINTAIHVRRGDYLSLPHFYCQISMEYYMEAIDIIYRLYDTKQKFFVFSDDIPWCKETLPEYFDVTYFSEGNTPLQDLWLMSQCDCVVLPNSSFGWWGGWLATYANQDKTAISPGGKKWGWFQPEVNKPMDDFLPTWGWIRL